MLNSNQVKMIYTNTPHMHISRYIAEKDFLVSLLIHLQTRFESANIKFEFSTPYFNELGYTSDSSYITINELEFGQLFFLKDPFSQEITMFIYSEPLNIKYYLLENDFFNQITINQYNFFIESIFGFYVSLADELED